ncbi:NAD(P)-binding protein [Trematosphaeria pertusa]|uniref:NAD(P)-binding protein n=1 Tax=Trematosphaeria pertusa TaxID=390896 RepID=A0A6A6IIJ3_9PLEO|nr:NAD(P)-binding protein [Trematosphaeria pertusa]KAF2249997.1 NAD(P)-binding protein [Trematosphaeria pertusa]
MPPIAPGSLVLVTGANGFVAGVLIDKLLAAGYKVRGTVRSLEKNKWMSTHYGPSFSLSEVPDLSVPGALDEAVKGCDAVANVASNTAIDPDPSVFIPPVIKATVNVLESAAKEPKVKNVVYTSSVVAMAHQVPGEPRVLDKHSWNEYALKEAWNPDAKEEGLARMLVNYACSKAASEKACWDWMAAHKPGFTFNTVCPPVVLGAPSAAIYTGFSSSAGFAKMLWDGHPEIAFMIPPQWYVDVEDVALLHVAALSQPDVENERLMAFAGKFTWNEVLGALRKFAPERSWPERIEEPPADQASVDIGSSAELLKRLGKKDGFASLEEAVRKWVECMVEAEKMDGVPESLVDKMAAQLNAGK